jgi:threonine/homoserine/homoserine lactone efflux protein
MKRFFFLFVLIVGAVVFLLNASNDVRSVLGWAVTGYLLFRALPAVRADFGWLRRGIRSQTRRGFRASKVDTL